MNVISFKEGACARFRKLLDEYLSNELTTKLKEEAFSHLERCPRCAEELEIRRRVKATLKRAVNHDDAAPDMLRESVLIQLNASPRRSGQGAWRLAVAAAVALIFGGVVVTRLLTAQRDLKTSPQVEGRTIVVDDAISAKNDEAFNLGLGDHVHCALHRDYSSGPRSFEQMSKDLGPDYSDLLTLVKDRSPQNFTMMIGHNCEYKGRNFVHLVLKNENTVLSVILTKRNGAGFDGTASASAQQNAGVPLFRARLQDQAVVGFQTRDYLAYIISSLPLEDHFQLAVGLAPSVHNFLAKLEI